MRRTSLMIITLCSIAFSQTVIPPPPGHPAARIMKCVNVGDFDGDGSEDIYVKCSEGSGSIFGIYSLKKSTYLFAEGTIPTIGYPDAPEAVGDFNGDGRNEVVVLGKVYVFNSPTLNKKKSAGP